MKYRNNASLKWQSKENSTREGLLLSLQLWKALKCKPSAHIARAYTLIEELAEYMSFWGWKGTYMLRLKYSDRVKRGNKSQGHAYSSNLIVKCGFLYLHVAHARIYHCMRRAQRSSACQFSRLLLAICFCSRPLRQSLVYSSSFRTPLISKVRESRRRWAQTHFLGFFTRVSRHNFQTKSFPFYYPCSRSTEAVGITGFLPCSLVKQISGNRQTDTHTHTHTDRPSTVTLVAHARRGLIMF